jgi:hypothetical protein
VLAVPQTAQGTVGVRELIELALQVNPACLPSRAVLPEGAEAVRGDRAEPAAEGPGPQVMFKLRQLTQQDAEHFLYEIVGVLGPDAVVTQPTMDEGRAQIDEPPPRARSRSAAQPLEQR